jgi:hypothetical protein
MILTQMLDAFPILLFIIPDIWIAIVVVVPEHL